ncbi:hypothetical protein BVE84_05780 [Streptococcus azizii]|uniref:Uncharacterized protein n=1 Tax=Streptococcus azizii TaxID=1579424 RepID=A0AB36JQ46_9STRE|nr:MULTISPECIES: hypothetical protein [Streptococcus]MBF0776019.1 hypothetical protein [Streptococcus sp. 19428wD3_AN2]ONK26350.1 hypothetical protein BVE86_07720 [Streptococcus azizii]ONK28165.1 hypothetical protein BVE85_04945 [Streptococcus azizii]ONK29097.1 hypothetical protein BVE84_05780 [Streptococcus azizii]TFU83813.1 hypothetical protein E4T83_04390 [Streptococcus sp. AN2]
MVNKSTIRKVIVAILLLAIGAFLLIPRLFSSAPEQFSIQSDVDFYVVGYHNIEGYKLKNNTFQKVSDDEVEIVKGQINPVLKRAEISNRYLVFSEEGPPLGVVGRIVSVDFKTGKINYNKTSDYAFTSSGVGPDYYFTSEANTDDSFIAVFDANLKEIDKYIFNDSIITTDFSNDGDYIYFLGTYVKGEGSYPTYLHHFSFDNKKIQLQNQEILYDHPEFTYFFHDSIVRRHQFYSVSSGYRINATKERVVLGQVFHYDMESGRKEFFDLSEVAPVNIFELNEDLLAIEHERNDSGKIGFSLFNVRNHTSHFVDLSQLGLSVETDYLKDIKQIDDNTLLVLAGSKLIEYAIRENTIMFKKEIDADMFHIWVN